MLNLQTARLTRGRDAVLSRAEFSQVTAISLDERGGIV